MKLILCLLIDAIGMGTYAVPLAGELGDIAWAPMQLILVRMITGQFSSKVFWEEALPFTDIIPSATMKYIATR
jgi:hypothetical protein